MKTFLAATIIILSSITTYGEGIPTYLQDISVTIRAGDSEGSGTIVTREINGEKVNFVWTAGHVVDGLKTIRSVIGDDGATKQVIEFKDAEVVKELVENGRRIGELKLDAEVIKFSNHNSGDDLALLRIRKKNFIQNTAKFYLDEAIPELGTPLYHVGSLLGTVGSNSMTSGILSQIGRVSEGTVYDQTTVAAFPGCVIGSTFVTMYNGIEKQIKDLQPGEKIISFDLERNLLTKGKVIKVWSTGIKPIFNITTNYKSIKVSGNHPFAKTNNNKIIWTRADDLLPGDRVHTLNNGEIIRSVELYGEEMTYDMEVASYHNFFANGFLVHNSSGGGVYLQDGRYIGMLVRGAGESFNLIVPIRRLKMWAKKYNLEFAINPDVAVPSEEEFSKMPKEDVGSKISPNELFKSFILNPGGTKFLLK